MFLAVARYSFHLDWDSVDLPSWGPVSLCGLTHFFFFFLNRSSAKWAQFLFLAGKLKLEVECVIQCTCKWSHCFFVWGGFEHLISTTNLIPGEELENLACVKSCASNSVLPACIQMVGAVDAVEPGLSLLSWLQ